MATDLPAVPSTYTATRSALQLVAEHISRARRHATGKEQRAGEWEVWETSLHNPDFADYARSCGAPGITVTATRDLDSALVTAFARQGGPVLVHVRADPDLL